MHAINLQPGHGTLNICSQSLQKSQTTPEKSCSICCWSLQINVAQATELGTPSRRSHRRMPSPCPGRLGNESHIQHLHDTGTDPSLHPLSEPLFLMRVIYFKISTYIFILIWHFLYFHLGKLVLASKQMKGWPMSWKLQKKMFQGLKGGDTFQTFNHRYDFNQRPSIFYQQD